MRMILVTGKMRWIVPLGSSGNPGSKNYYDQLDLWAEGETIPQIWNWEEITSSCSKQLIKRFNPSFQNFFFEIILNVSFSHQFLSLNLKLTQLNKTIFNFGMICCDFFRIIFNMNHILINNKIVHYGRCLQCC